MRTIRTAVGVAVVCLGVAASGCAVVPPESVQLSSTIGKDLVELRKSHLDFIDAYYGRIEAQVSRAVDQIYAPGVISAALRGTTGRVLLQRLEAGKQGGDAANDAIAIAGRLLQNIRREVEARREADLKPIRDARAKARSEVDQAYANVMRGNATVTAYLASVAKVREAQDDLFKQVGLEGLPQRTSETLADASTNLDDLLVDAKERDAQLDVLKARLDKILEAIRK
jgi:hypothetical protein